MRLITGTFAFSIFRHDSFSAYEAIASAQSSETYEFGDRQLGLSCWSIVWSPVLGHPIAQLLVHPTVRGLEPTLLPIAEMNRLLLGFDRSVCGVDLQTARVIFERELLAPFVDFFHLAEGAVLILYETGAIALNRDLKYIWEFAGDLIQEARVESEILHLNFADDPPVALSLKNGVHISHS